MSRLIDQLEKLEGRQPYQSYTVQHGIERLQLLIPLHQSKIFEEEFNLLSDKRKKTILELVHRLGGKARG